MIVFTPKSMLRNKAAVSAVTDFTTGRFQPVIDDPTVNPEQVSTVLFTSGKFYYELDAYRRSTGNTTTAIVRVEKLYPVPHRSLGATLSRYPNAIDLRWVQEEPGNQGAWPFFGLALPELDTRFTGIKRISRRAMAAPSAGSARVHDVEQAAVIATAFA
jgi:2-oxoglutarate decarboxylase